MKMLIDFCFNHGFITNTKKLYFSHTPSNSSIKLMVEEAINKDIYCITGPCFGFDKAQIMLYWIGNNLVKYRSIFDFYNCNCFLYKNSFYIKDHDDHKVYNKDKLFLPDNFYYTNVPVYKPFKIVDLSLESMFTVL